MKSISVRVEPIWGNGWWDGEKTVEPPAPFSISLSEGALEQGFQGVIEGESALAGRVISGSRTFANEPDYFTVMLRGADHDSVKDDTGKVLSGYVKVI